MKSGAGLALGRQDRVGLTERHRHRLLHEDMLAGAQKIGRNISLDDIVGRDGGSFDFRIVAEIAMRGDDAGNAVTVGDGAGQFRPQLRERDKFSLR